MPIDDRTSTQNYPKPNIGNTLADDVGRLRTALDDIDADMAERVTTSDTGTVSTTMLANDAVTYAKIQNVSATDKLLGRSTAGAGDVEEITCTAAGRNLLDDADAAAQRTTLGLGTLATQSGTFSGTSSGTNTGDQTITLTGDVTGSGTGSFTTAIAAGVIVDADINASAGIVDTKLATIATAGKVSNSATTATNANTASAIVARDASGNFSAGTITANLTGTASAIADNTVTSAKIVNGTIVNADVNDSAAIAGTKVSPDFGSQNVVTTGTTTTSQAVLTGATSGTVGLAAPAVAGNNTLTLPTGNGSAGQVLETNGSGVLGWVTISTTPTTTQVLDATAGASTGDVGTYAFLIRASVGISTTYANPGDTKPGSEMSYSSIAGATGLITTGTNPSGTWRCMGFARNTSTTVSQAVATSWLRIS